MANAQRKSLDDENEVQTALNTVLKPKKSAQSRTPELHEIPTRISREKHAHAGVRGDQMRRNSTMIHLTLNGSFAILTIALPSQEGI